MKHFIVTFTKKPQLLSSMNIKQTATQHYFSETQKIAIEIPIGYTVTNVEEQLPDIHLSKAFVDQSKDNGTHN